MSTNEINRLVARYLDGAMSAAEEEEFFVRMALDGELRRSYQAQRIVESALRKQQQAAPRPTGAARARLEQSLASRPSAPHAPARGGWRRDVVIAIVTTIVASTVILIAVDASRSAPDEAVPRIDTTAQHEAVENEALEDDPTTPETVSPPEEPPAIVTGVRREKPQRTKVSQDTVGTPVAMPLATPLSTPVATHATRATDGDRANDVESLRPNAAAMHPPQDSPQPPDSIRLEVRVKRP